MPVNVFVKRCENFAMLVFGILNIVRHFLRVFRLIVRMREYVHRNETKSAWNDFDEQLWACIWAVHVYCFFQFFLPHTLREKMLWYGRGGKNFRIDFPHLLCCRGFSLYFIFWRDFCLLCITIRMLSHDAVINVVIAFVGGDSIAVLLPDPSKAPSIPFLCFSSFWRV